MSERKDGRSRDTRERILKEAESLYYAGGYEHISLQTIADQLHISKAALFHHFKNKQTLFFELLLAIMAHHRQRLNEAVKEGASSARATLRRIMVHFTQEPGFDMNRFAHEEFDLLTPEQQQETSRAWRSSLLAVVKEVLEVGIEKSELRSHDTELASHLFLHMCLLVSHFDSEQTLPLQSIPVSLDEHIDALLDIFFVGLGKDSHLLL